MRVLSIVAAAALFCSLAKAGAQDVEVAVEAYTAHANEIAAQLLFAEFAKHNDRVHDLAVTFSLQIDAQGRPHNVQIVSRTHNAFIEDTARRTLSAAKFPPFPKKVIQGLGETMLVLQADIDANVSR